MDKNTEEVISTPSGEAFDKARAADAVTADKALINGLTAERNQLVIKVGEARRELAAEKSATADLVSKVDSLIAERDADRAEIERLNALAERDTKRIDGLLTERDAARDALTDLRRNRALTLDRAEASRVQVALTNAPALAAELREFLGHFSGDKRAALDRLINETTAADLPALSKAITGHLGMWDLAGCIPPPIPGRSGRGPQ